MPDARTIAALEKLARVPGLNPTWNQALGPPTLGARAHTALSGAATKATGGHGIIGGAGHVAGRAVGTAARPVAAIAKGAVGGTAYLGAQALAGAGKRAVGFAGRNPGTAFGTLAFMGLGGIGLQANPALKNVGQKSRAAASGFFKGSSAMNRREQILRSQSDEFVKTAAPGGTLNRLRGILGGGAKSVGKAVDRPAKASLPSDWGRIGGSLLALTALGGALATGAKAADSVTDYAADRMLRGNKRDQFRQMLRVDPELAREPNAGQYFDMVYRASNYVSSEPVLAAGVVRSMVDQGSPDEDGFHAKDLSEKARAILDIEKARQGSRYPFSLSGRKSDLASTVKAPAFDLLAGG